MNILCIIPTPRRLPSNATVQAPMRQSTSTMPIPLWLPTNRALPSGMRSGCRNEYRNQTRATRCIARPKTRANRGR